MYKVIQTIIQLRRYCECYFKIYIKTYDFCNNQCKICCYNMKL